MIDDWRSGYKWSQALNLLSLDFMRPIYADLGVGITREETLRGLARDTLTWQLHPDTHSDPGSPDGLAVFFHSQVSELLKIADAALGPQSGAALTYWVEFVHDQDEDTNPWAIYQDAFLSWASRLRTTGVDELGLGIDAAQVALRLRRPEDGARVSVTLERRRTGCFSDWDFLRFKEAGLLEIPKGSEFFPFINEAELATQMHHFHTFWGWLVSLASPKDLQAIDRFVRRHRARNTVHVSPENLPRRMRD